MRKNKRSILGLETVKGFIVVLLALAIIGVVALVVLGSITTTSIISQTGISITGRYANNETITSVNEAGEYLACNSQVSPTCSNILAINSTSGTVIGSSNYTASNCLVAFSAGNDAKGLNNSDWKVTYDCAYRDSSKPLGIVGNVSNGISSFFTNASTYFSLLGVVVIILIISLVVVVVNRFGGEDKQEASTM